MENNLPSVDEIVDAITPVQYWNRNKNYPLYSTKDLIAAMQEYASLKDERIKELENFLRTIRTGDLETIRKEASCLLIKK